MPDKKLLKRREGKLKDRRAKRDSGDITKDKTGKKVEEEPEEAGDEEEENEAYALIKNKRLDEQKEKKKTRKGWVDFLYAVAENRFSFTWIDFISMQRWES